MIQEYQVFSRGKSSFGRDATNIQNRKPQSCITAIYIVPDISIRLFSACEMRSVCSEQSFDSVFANDIKWSHGKHRVRRASCSMQSTNDKKNSIMYIWINFPNHSFLNQCFLHKYIILSYIVSWIKANYLQHDPCITVLHVVIKLVFHNYPYNKKTWKSHGYKTVRFKSAFKLIETGNNYSRRNRLLKRGEGYRRHA